VKVQIFYDQDGTIQSVVKMAEGATLRPMSPDHASAKVDLSRHKVRSAADLHAAFRISGRGKLEPKRAAKKRKAR
jgi:hypothetical protein